MKRLILFLLFLEPAFARTVWFQVPESSNENFQEFLQKETGRVSFSDEYRKQPVESSKRERLSDLLERAQRSFLSDSPEKADTQFKAVTDMALEEDWSFADKQAILTAWLRRAQIAASPEERRKRFSEAASFSPDVSPEPSLFQPPLLGEFRSVRETLSFQAVNWEPQAPDFSFVILDGHFFRLGPSTQLKLFPGSHRVTFVSDRYQTATRVGSSTELAVLTAPMTSPHVRGECEKPVLSANRALRTSDVGVWFSPGCQTVLKDGRWEPLEAPPAVSPYLNTAAFSEGFMTKSPPQREEKSILRSPVFWIVTGLVLTAGYNYWKMQNMKSDRRQDSPPPPAQTTVSNTPPPSPPAETVLVPNHRVN